MAKANKCSNIKDPKARKACLAKAKKPGGGSASNPGTLGKLASEAVKRML
jgi:hypothetical protein